MDFSKFDLIIDARSQREYLEDHVPGAVNWPVVNDEEYAEVGTLHRTDKQGAYSIGVRYSLANISRHIEQDLSKYDFKTRVLVYCFRGGKRSRLWFNALDTIGYQVQTLPGGWKAYRAFVNQSLATVPAQFRYNVLSGPTGCGKTRLLSALQRVGAQVLDLEDIARHRGSVIGAIPGVHQPTQKYFDSTLLARFRAFDANRPIWVEAESKKIGNVQLPEALLDTMRAGSTFQVESEMQQRVALWREDYRHFEEDPDALMQRLSFLIPLVGNKEFGDWEELARQRQMPRLFEVLMRRHYDPTYERSILRNYPAIKSSPRLPLEDLSTDALDRVARELISANGG